MSSSRLSLVALAAFALAAPRPALAQEFGLDLTEDEPAPAPKPAAKPAPKPAAKPAKPVAAPPPAAAESAEEAPAPAAPAPAGDSAMEFGGLDLSDAPSGPDFRPAVALFGVVPSAAKEQPGPVDAARAQAVEAMLVRAAQASRWFSKVVDPAKVKEDLGERDWEAAACSSAPCFEDLSDALDVQRVVAAHLVFGAASQTLQLWSYDRGSGEVKPLEVDAGGKGVLADRKLADGMKPALQTLSTQLAMLKVNSNTAGATVMLGEKTLGAGSLEKLVAPGKYPVRVADPNMLPFESEVTLEAGKVVELVANLEARPPPAAYQDEDLEAALRHKGEGGPSFLKKPGLYVAAAGVVALAVGAGFGLSASAAEGRAVDSNNDGILEATRAELIGAQGSAKVANALFGAGAAALIGGGVWFYFDRPAAPAPAPAAAPASAPQASRFVIGVGGEL